MEPVFGANLGSWLCATATHPHGPGICRKHFVYALNTRETLHIKHSHYFDNNHDTYYGIYAKCSWLDTRGTAYPHTKSDQRTLVGTVSAYSNEQTVVLQIGIASLMTCKRILRSFARSIRQVSARTDVCARADNDSA